MNSIPLYFRLLRIPHWVKNLFVCAPLLFAGKLHETGKLLNVAAAFFLFCAASSAVYIFNDIHDRENDRNHPDKSKRPVASGRVPISIAAVFSLVLGIGALTASWFIAPQTEDGTLSRMVFVMIAVYIGQNILYTLFLKHVVILDIFIIAFGFVLRVLAGGFAAPVAISPWILICTTLLALFLGFSKRRNELVLLGEDSADHRKILEEYSPAFLDQMMGIVTACTVMSYMLYTIAEETIGKFGPNLIYTVVFVLYGIFRYLYLVYQKGKGGSPTKIMISDVPLIINVILWAVSCGLIVYTGGR